MVFVNILLGLIFIITALASASILWVAILSGVPPAPCSREQADQVVTLLSQGQEPKRIYELGCGFGYLAWRLSRAFPESTVIAIERSWVPFLIAKLMARVCASTRNIEVRWGDFNGVAGNDLHTAQAVCAYLMIKAMPELARTLDRHLSSGTPVVALSFWFRDRKPSTILPKYERDPDLTPMHSGREIALYRW